MHNVLCTFFINRMVFMLYPHKSSLCFIHSIYIEYFLQNAKLLIEYSEEIRLTSLIIR